MTGITVTFPAGMAPTSTGRPTVMLALYKNCTVGVGDTVSPWTVPADRKIERREMADETFIALDENMVDEANGYLGSYGK